MTFNPLLRYGRAITMAAALAAILAGSLSIPDISKAEEASRFGDWTADTNFSVPGEKLCWLHNDEVAFVMLLIEADGHRGEWLSKYTEEAAFPTSFHVRIDDLEFSGEESVGGPLVVQAMKRGLWMTYRYRLPSGERRGRVSLVGFTDGYEYCEAQMKEQESDG